MVKHYSKALLVLGLAVLLVGCAAQQPMTGRETGFNAIDLNVKLESGEYAQKVDNFLVILDASGTMTEANKWQRAKEVLSRMNQTIPDLRLTSALRTFGQGFSDATALPYGLMGYTKAGLQSALDSVTGFGQSPMGGAINAATKDLENLQGNIAVIVVSDGKETDAASLMAAENMKKRFGDRICIYTVLVGDDPAGTAIMDQIAKAGKCGSSVIAEQIMSSQGMAGFVEKVFLRKTMMPPKPEKLAMPADSDSDGVLDNMDRCPNTPRGVKVDAQGCPLDMDRDGVFDYLDKCLGTPRGVTVDARGCPLDTDGDGVYDYLDKCPRTPKGASVNAVGCWVLAGVEFDTNKWDIKGRYYSILNEAVAVLKKNPTLKVEVQGHTDNRGSAAYNQRLSEKRAQAVMQYLSNAGIARYRLTAVGYGFSRPAVPNTTPENMATNRRVELKPIW
jgi:OOP family OmpA-OmpF porin